MKSKMKKVGVALLLTFLVSSTSIIKENNANAQKVPNCYFSMAYGCSSGGAVVCAVCD